MSESITSSYIILNKKAKQIPFWGPTKANTLNTFTVKIEIRASSKHWRFLGNFNLQIAGSLHERVEIAARSALVNRRLNRGSNRSKNCLCSL